MLSSTHRLGAAVVATLALALATTCPASEGAGDLLVAPTRVTLQGSTRSASVTLRNTGTKAALYRISLEHFRMENDGTTRMVDTPSPDEILADSLVRFSPRQVLLAAGETQVVRILLRKPADLAVGEYRTHLTFRAVPDAPDPVADVPQAGWTVNLRAVYGVSIPVLVWNGTTSASVTLVEARLMAATAGQPPLVEVRLDRVGTRSAYGDIEIATASGPRVVIGRARGVAVWFPNSTRNVKVPLGAGTVLPPGPLVATFTARDTGEATSLSVAR